MTMPNMPKFSAIAGTLASLLLLAAPPALAAEQVLLRYRGFSRTVPTAALATLAETGEPPRALGVLLRQAGQDPENLRSLLTRQLPADPVILDKALNSWPGEWLLDQMGVAIHPVAGGASRQALRSALVLSAANDNQISLLEVLQTYPTDVVVLEGNEIESAYTRLATFLRPLTRIFL
jgi:hypothetical protein